MENFSVIYTTSPSLENAKNIVSSLIDSKFIACANIFHSHSMYFWKNQLKTDNEYVIIMKTCLYHVDNVMKMVSQYNEYDVPAIFSIPVDIVDKNYLSWLNGVLPSLPE